MPSSFEQWLVFYEPLNADKGGMKSNKSMRDPIAECSLLASIVLSCYAPVTVLERLLNKYTVPRPLIHESYSRPRAVKVNNSRRHRDGPGQSQRENLAELPLPMRQSERQRA